MRGRRCLAAVVLLLGAGACSDDDGEPDAGDGGQVEQLAERSGLDPELVMDVVCDAWVTEGLDRPTVNEYVRDLLLPLDLVNSPDRPGYGQEDIDAAVFEACEDQVDDPPAFVAQVLDRLDLTHEDLDQRVAAACSRYGVQQQRIAEGDWSGDDLADLVRTLLSERGLELARLRTAITGICG